VNPRKRRWPLGPTRQQLYQATRKAGLDLPAGRDHESRLEFREWAAADSPGTWAQWQDRLLGIACQELALEGCVRDWIAAGAPGTLAEWLPPDWAEPEE
jgi:hypothetical protein